MCTVLLQLVIVLRLIIWTRFSKSNVLFDAFKDLYLISEVGFYKDAMRSALFEVVISVYFEASQAPVGIDIYPSPKSVQLQVFFSTEDHSAAHSSLS